MMSEATPDEAVSFPRHVTLPPPRFQTARVIGALILREMGSTYGRSPGGYLWAVLSPVGVIVILALAFSLVVRVPALGTSFVLFYATGYLPFELVMGLTGVLSASITYSRPLLAYPRVTWMDSVIARFLLNVLTKIVIAVLVMGGIMLCVDAHVRLNFAHLGMALVMGALLGLGMGLMNCLLGGLFPVWGRIWGIASRPLFLASGIIFLIEELPRNLRDLLAWNPVAHVIAETRLGFYPMYHPGFVSYSYVLGVGLALTAFALLLLHRWYRTVLER